MAIDAALQSEQSRGLATRSTAWGSNGMVAAAQPMAVGAGVDILRRGGSAVDAALAVNACLSVMEPTACGLGGDLFAIVWSPEAGALAGLNASGRAPAALSIDRVRPTRDGTIPLFSPFSWTVPGAVNGWFALHGRCGRLRMADILAPAIDYAEHGFPVTAVIAGGWAASARQHARTPGFADVFMPGGSAPGEGEVFRNPALARTLRLLAEGGADAYYRGPVADAIVRFSQLHDGSFSHEDFAADAPTWEEPLCTTYRGQTVWELPPPGQGIATLQLLNLLEIFDLASMGRGSADFWHLLVEAKKLVYADRARYYADPGFAEVPVEWLISKAYAHERAERIDPQRAAETDAPGETAALNRSDTTYLCAADRDGMMVSLIQSNYTGFGSGYAVPEVGFGLQDRGGLFSLDPAHPNALQPGKRPFHTIIPGFVTRDGAPLMAFGVMGGDQQPQGQVQVLANLFDFGMGLQEAGDAPRFHHGGSSEPTGTVMQGGGVLNLEAGIPSEVLSELELRGHHIEPAPPGVYGGYQAVWRHPETGVYAGATESRKDGIALGY